MGNKSDNQIPIFRFLNKHKWRILIPLLFALLYWAVPRYQSMQFPIQQQISLKSEMLTSEEFRKEIFAKKEKIYSEKYLLGLINRYDLFQSERKQNTAEPVLVEKLRNSIDVYFNDPININPNEYASRPAGKIWIVLETEDAKKIISVSNHLITEFEKNTNIKSEKLVSAPIQTNTLTFLVFIGSILQGLILIVIPLILIWEIPNLFFSQKTKEMVFEPIKSDWQEEYFEALNSKETWKARWINVRYAYAFLLAMVQKSPIGDLFEFILKIALKVAK